MERNRKKGRRRKIIELWGLCESLVNPIVDRIYYPTVFYIDFNFIKKLRVPELITFPVLKVPVQIIKHFEF